MADDLEVCPSCGALPCDLRKAMAEFVAAVDRVYGPASDTDIAALSQTLGSKWRLVTKLAREYRPAMEELALHSWAADITAAISQSSPPISGEVEDGLTARVRYVDEATGAKDFHFRKASLTRHDIRSILIALSAPDHPVSEQGEAIREAAAKIVEDAIGLIGPRTKSDLAAVIRAMPLPAQPHRQEVKEGEGRGNG